MSIYDAIDSLKSILPLSAEDAQKFLDTLDSDTQEQLISAIYLGREHIHSTSLRDDPDIELSRSYTDHIGKDEYARIIHEKGENSVTYLNKLEECAKSSGFDLNSL